ncbi:alpha/beta fold hydrolase [Croceivirga thetidis]|uniref:Alpha/beta hydrolase n=1 Tax=Croceivirga thetidis TaxID=2721623 RepID=A0ABX1GVX4_9FLAO|nr:alpha/beta hydrolase [Croceivirga thetidis]NKI33176.1 alpha/beta hydrolase [Croceivirga thetidis]
MRKIIKALIAFTYGKWFNFWVNVNPRNTAKKAFDVFCTIRLGKVLPNQKAFLDAAKLDVKEVAGHQIQSYHWSGKKGPILLMHGWESNTFRWRNFINMLRAKDFEIFAFDAPSHGYSSGKKLHVPLYAEATQHVLEAYRPKWVVAHSVGGMTINYTHFLNPDTTVEKVVTIGSPSEFSQFMDSYQKIVPFNNKVRMAMDSYLKEWLGFHFKEFSSARFVSNSTKKGLLFHDKYDLQVPYTESVRVHENWEGSELRLTEGLGHSMHQKQVNEDIISFLES